MKKQGAILDLFIWIIVGFVILLFFGIWLYTHNLLTTELLAVDTPSNINFSQAVTDVFVPINDAYASLRWMTVGILFASAMAILLSNFLIKAHPAFFFVYILIIIVAISLSAIVANIYEDDILTNDRIGDTMASFRGGTWIFLHLPVWVAVIGIFGAIFLFIGIIRDRGSGGSPV